MLWQMMPGRAKHQACVSFCVSTLVNHEPWTAALWTGLSNCLCIETIFLYCAWRYVIQLWRHVRQHQPYLKTVLGKGDAAGKAARRKPCHRHMQGLSVLQLSLAMPEEARYIPGVWRVQCTWAEKWSTQPMNLGASGTVKVRFRCPCLFAGSSSHSADLPDRPKTLLGTKVHQTVIFQPIMFLETLFCMRKAFSVHELIFLFWKTSLSSKILNTDNFYPNSL